jgi:hypothetical protein
MQRLNLIILMILAATLIHTNMVINAAKAERQVIMDSKLDAAYVKGFEAALDCRAMLSAPMCEMILQKAGKDNAKRI